MYTKVYGCACWWSSCVSVYFFIRCWAMWLYLFLYDCAKGFSMYAFALIVNHFIVSRTYSVRFDCFFRLTVTVCVLTLYMWGDTWNALLQSSRRWFCRDSANASMDTLVGPLCSSCAHACSGRVLTFCRHCMCYLLIRETVYVTNWGNCLRSVGRCHVDSHAYYVVCMVTLHTRHYI